MNHRHLQVFSLTIVGNKAESHLLFESLHVGGPQKLSVSPMELYLKQNT